jgi:glucose-1-phosphate thymidylyltransferase
MESAGAWTSATPCTDLNRLYLEQGSLQVELFGRGVAWLDTGTHESLMQASNFIQTVEERQGLKVACPEEVAYIKGWIGAEQVLSLAEPLKETGYGQYLIDLIQRAR